MPQTIRNDGRGNAGGQRNLSPVDFVKKIRYTQYKLFLKRGGIDR